jgi:antitoxin ParD1/3/4
MPHPDTIALAELKAEIPRGLADVAAGRIVDFNVERIIERGRKLLADRSAKVRRGQNLTTDN